LSAWLSFQWDQAGRFQRQCRASFTRNQDACAARLRRPEVERDPLG
jgi:hypothetical protein